MRSFVWIVAAACVGFGFGGEARAFEALRFFGLHCGPGYHSRGAWASPAPTAGGYSNAIGYPLNAHETVYPGYSSSVNRVPAFGPQPSYPAPRSSVKGVSYTTDMNEGYAASELSSDYYSNDMGAATMVDGGMYQEADMSGFGGYSSCDTCGSACEASCCEPACPPRCGLFARLKARCQAMCRPSACGGFGGCHDTCCEPACGSTCFRRRSWCCPRPCRDYCPSCDCRWCRRSCCGAASSCCGSVSQSCCGESGDMGMMYDGGMEYAPADAPSAPVPAPGETIPMPMSESTT